jgi:meso-butanediol dehydrogenase/(S,S)-butanediol dehydrogenase/diacetyl reductase
MEQRFKHKTVIVTGAAGNIGEGVVRRFSAEGANVVLAARTTAKLEALAAELDPQRTLSVTTDVTSQPGAQPASARGRTLPKPKGMSLQ